MSTIIDTTESTGTATAPVLPKQRRRSPLRRSVPPPPPSTEIVMPKRPRRRKWVAAGLAVVLLAGTGTAWALTRGSGTPAPAARTVTATIATGDVSQSVQTSGTVAAADVEDLSFPSSGTVNAVKVTLGEKVTKGQALASIDPTSLQLAVNSAQASYTQAAAQLSSAQDNLAADQATLKALQETTASTTTSATDLATQEATEQSAITSDNAQVTGAQSQVSSAQQRLTAAKTALSGATLTAPIAGEVAAVNVAIGDSASSGTAIEVIGTKNWVVSTSVSGADADSIKVGQEVTITTSGSSTPVYGTVATIGATAAASSSGGAVEFPVTIDVTGTPTGLHPGDTASVSIITQQLSNVLTVPTAAVSQNTSGQTVVTKLVNGSPQAVAVTLGASYGTSTVVTSGLSAGDQVQYTITGLAGSVSRSTTRTGTGGAGGATAFGGGTFGGGSFSGAPTGP
jgi:RND family efflux transporter MFP subunit